MKRRTAVALAAAAVALVAAGLVLWSTTRPTGPEDAARAYLTALEDGDPRAVAGSLADVRGTDYERLLAAFAAASSYPAAPRVEELDGDARTAAVQATATLDGAERRISFRMEQIDGRWQVTDGFLARVEISTTIGAAVRVGDVLIATGTTSLLPAVYEFAAAPDGLVTGGATTAVSNDQATEVHVDASLTADATARAQAQVDAYATACASGGTEVPGACGLRIPWAADLAAATRFAFRVEQLPAVAIAPDARSFEATGGVIVATVSGTDRGGAPAVFTYRNDAWSLRGEVRVDGSEILLSVH